MPPLGLLTGGLDFSNLMVVLKDGATAPPGVGPAAGALSRRAWYLPTPVVVNRASALERRPGGAARLAGLGSERGAAPSVALRLVYRCTPAPGAPSFS